MYLPARVLFVVVVVSSTGAIAAEADFSGNWATSFGPMTLRQQDDRVTGHYIMFGGRCTIEGRVEGRKLTFTYHEPEARGEGWFELAQDGNRFLGRWLEEGSNEWAPWTGQRVQVDAAPVGFDGLWDTTYGPMRLIVDEKKVAGRYAQSGGSTIQGNLEGRRLNFQYQEPDAKGEGWFQLADDGRSFAGKWKEADAENWSDWSGTRVLPAVDRVWLVVVEARWESSLKEREYSFGSMLRAFFNRVPRVEIRHRFFSNTEGFRRWCGELTYLAEPVVLVIASHGEGGSVTVGGETLGPDELADALRFAGNLKLVHFSACEIMQGDSAQRLQKQLQRRVPISGYTTSVDWVASAVIEFLYLNLILEKRMSPADAARQTLQLAPFAGDQPIPDAAIPPAGFRLLLANVEEETEEADDREEPDDAGETEDAPEPEDAEAREPAPAAGR